MEQEINNFQLQFTKFIWTHLISFQLMLLVYVTLVICAI